MNEPTQLNILSEIPPVFSCEIDESAGQREDHENTQLTELPGDTWEDIFRRSAARMMDWYGRTKDAE